MTWAFNLAPSTYCHPSWLPAGAMQLATLQEPQAACHRYLSPWLLGQHGLDDAFEFEFRDKLERMALLDAPAIDAIAAALGLLARRDALSRVVERETLEQIKAASGITNIAALLQSASRFPLRRRLGGLPLLDAGRLADDTPHGRLLLLGLMHRLSRPVRARFRLRFSREECAMPRPKLVARAHVPDLCAWMVDEWIPTVLPRWAWLFC